MFTGIIEDLGEITNIERKNGNLNITVKCGFTNELKIDQSVAHNGVCLTVVDVMDSEYKVTAIDETLKKTSIGHLKINDIINLERGMKLGERLDGHIVQGHVDQIGTCDKILDSNGSWIFTFSYEAALSNVTIEKGSITVNGVSLTVVDSKNDSFSVAIIPYTFNHTNFKNIKSGDVVNLEFDVIGKYVKRLTKR
ncbi:MAG: riboflavin synthase [Bacteroidetes bacterium]|nr:MAG: riboflavin synthase [Bacteroidota bacterium]